MAADNGTTTTNDNSNNTYEEARKQRLEENKKRFEDLGILSISKSLSNIASPEKKAKQRIPKPKLEKSTEAFEPRRSSRARNPVPSYRYEDDDVGIKRMRKRSSSRAWESYLQRPIDEVKLASYEDRMRALKVAEEFESNLQSGNPSFVKSMVRSHVYSCFWLGLPTHFCNRHLPKKDVDMILVDENGSEYDAKYIGRRVGLSGGWRGFALDHKLDDGDAVVFELVEPDRFKLYTFRVSSLSGKNHDIDIEEGRGSTAAKNASKDSTKPDLHSSRTRKLKKAKIENDETVNNQKPAKTDLVSGRQTKKVKSTNAKKSETKIVDGDKDFKPRKKPAPRLFRKKA